MASQLPELLTTVPGPRSKELAQRLARVEGRGVTCLSPPPIFWERAQGANVWDVDGNRYLDLTSAFGVAHLGHAHPSVVAAVHQQSTKLLHGLGDVHPTASKLALLERLTGLFPGGHDARAVLGSSGSDAVEIALKTAMLASGRSGLLAFEGGYHGVSLGALDATWRSDFKDPFAARLPGGTVFAPFGDLQAVLQTARQADATGHPIGAILVEPVQGRGGDRIPPRGFLRGLRSLCDQEGWLLIADEIFTGFGRTGTFWACDHEEVVPDLLCAGKALSSGMPISVCLGRREVMDAWPLPAQEAIHTQTFLGHPPSCAAALASIEALEREQGTGRSAELGRSALENLRRGLANLETIREVRGMGLLIAIEFRSGQRAAQLVEDALRSGIILLQSGEAGEVVSISPALNLNSDVLEHAVATLVELVQVNRTEKTK